MSIKTTKISRGALKYALTGPSNRHLYQGCFILLAVAVWCAWCGQFLAAGALGALVIGVSSWLFKAGLDEYAMAEATGKQAMLATWAKEAATDAERERRRALLAAGNMDSAWDASNLSYEGPRYNTNGTLMLPGHAGFDINGNVYGATGLSSASFNPDTGAWADSTTSYVSPLEDSSSGMHDFGSGSTGIEMTPTKFD
jgi:hypothetical protein